MLWPHQPKLSSLLRAAHHSLVLGSHTKPEFQQDFILYQLPSQTYLHHITVLQRKLTIISLILQVWKLRLKSHSSQGSESGLDIF